MKTCRVEGWTRMERVLAGSVLLLIIFCLGLWVTMEWQLDVATQPELTIMTQPTRWDLSVQCPRCGAVQTVETEVPAKIAGAGK